MSSKECKKCHRPLPEGYKYKYCECCRNEQAQNAKKGVAIFTALGLGAAGIVQKVLNKK